MQASCPLSHRTQLGGRASESEQGAARVDRTATVRTATVRGGVSYLTTLRDGTRLADPANLPSDAQEFFVQRGSALVLVSVDGFSRAVDSTKGAQHTLRTLANRLG